MSSVLPGLSALVAAATAVEAVLPHNPLRGLLDQWIDARWTVVVAGRVGVGKSTLINSWLKMSLQPTGLFGVTAEPRHIRHPQFGWAEIVDTPGIDVEADAKALLWPLFAQADVVVWLTDGLQPMTAGERAVFFGSSSDFLLRVGVTRLDAVEYDEHADIVARVARLVAPRHPLSVEPLDPRAQAPFHWLDPAPTSSPRRLAAVRATLDATQAALAALPPPLTEAERLAKLRHLWREELDDLLEALIDEVDRGLISHSDIAQRRVVHFATSRLKQVRTRFLESHLPLPEEPIPFPLPTPAIGGPALLASPDAARRALRSEIARWAIAGEAALADALAESPIPEPPVRIAARTAVTAARRAVS